MATRPSVPRIAPRPLRERPDDWAFRPDVEGLRAVAIALVVLYHASMGPFAGGFVGVDVFYVLSGFLITGILLRELRATGSISLPAFYARRARRLLPAAALVLLITLVASVLVLPPLLVPGVATDTAAAALYVANLRFATQATDYFASAQAPSPILHYWSLGVEEQFYLLWPALLVLIARGAGKPVRRVGAAALVVALVSFVISLWLTTASEPLAFFLLPARAWELGLGAMLAVGGDWLRRLPAWAAAASGWVGLALIGLAGIRFSDATPFPGLAALVPTVGTALAVAGGTRPTAFGPTTLLGSAVPRFLGRISYSLYLWHWPVLVLPAAAASAPLPTPERIALVLAAIALAALTQRWVEDPIRRGRLVGTRPGRNLAMAGALALVVAALSVGGGAAVGQRLQGEPGTGNLQANAEALDRILSALASPSPGTPAGAARGSPAPSEIPTGGAGSSAAPTAGPSPTPNLPPTVDGPVPAQLQPSVAAAPEDYPQTFADGCHVQEGGIASRGTCIFGDLASKTTIALFGDSHAAFWFPAVEGFAERQGWRMLNLTMSSCTPADVTVYNSIFKRIYTECSTWREQAIERLVQTRPAVIVVAGDGLEPVDASGRLLTGDAVIAAWEAGTARTVERLIPAAGLVMLLADTPSSQFDPPTCLSAHPDSLLACATPPDKAINQALLAAERRVVAQTGIGFIDPTYWVCPSSPCPAVIGDFLVYQNAGHLTATFAAALTDRLGDAILEQQRAAAGITAREGPA